MNANVKKSVKILKKAMELIADEKRWTRVACYRVNEDSYCLVGAVDRASGTAIANLNTGGYYKRHENTLHTRALQKATKEANPELYNDRSQHHEVLAALHNAIDLLEAGVVT